jgi:hypothetical protein
VGSRLGFALTAVLPQALRQEAEDGGDREVLVIDTSALQAFLGKAKSAADLCIQERSKYKALAVLCSDALGGPDVTENAVDRMIKAVKKERKSNEVPLHVFLEKQLGYCRQRALLYKMTVDYVRMHHEHSQLRCRLARGFVNNEGHAWNVVQLGDDMLLCDTFQRPGELLPEGSDEVSAYSHAASPLRPPESRALLVESNYRIEWSEIELGDVIGQGGFSTVYAGTWRGSPVAVKDVKLRGDTTQRIAIAKQAHKELSLLASLQRFSGVIGLFGGSCEHERSFMVMPLMERRSLRSCLDEPASAPRNLFKVLLDPLEALHYLHSLPPSFGGPVIHYDIKPENIGVTYDWCGKLMDVGASKVLRHTVTTAAHLTADYSAPEVRRLEGSSTPSDIFSYGRMMLERSPPPLLPNSPPLPRTLSLACF